jgi:long-chain acyl-CoA synthetase
VTGSGAVDLVSLLDRTALSWADRPAVVSGERRITWAELDERVGHHAEALARSGVEPGSAVAIVLSNCPAFVVHFLAVARLGAIAVPLNPAYTPTELGTAIAHAEVAAVVCDDLRKANVEAALAAAGSTAPLVSVDPAAEGPIDTDLPSPVGGSFADHPVLYGFSSGSTGAPKRITRRQRHLVAEADNFAASVPLDADDVVLAVVPLFHAHGLGNGLLASLRSGACLVLAPEFQRRATLDLIRRERVTVFPAVPFMVDMLASLPASAGTDSGRLRWCFSAGAALPRTIFDAFTSRYGVPVRNLYGCTEGGSVTANLAEAPGAIAESVGRPLGSVTVEVRSEDGSPCAAGETGEVVITSPALAERYDGLPEATAESFRDGRFWSGDLGHVDAAGNLSVTGRRKLFIAANGLKVDPFEVEQVLARHRAVREVVVVGVPGSDGAEAVKAVVVTDGACDRKELIGWCRTHLAEFKVPRSIEFRDEIPRSPLGKVLRKYLVEPSATDPEGD